MSAPYNTALLRHLKAPTLAALGAIDVAVEGVIEGRVAPQELDVRRSAHEVASALGMIGSQAAARLARAIEEGVQALSEPDRRGWDHIRVQTVARALSSFVKAFAVHLQDMINGQGGPHVRLWPLWGALMQAMEREAPDVESLFEMDADFEDETFSPRPQVHLAETVDGAYERLLAAIGLVETARTTSNMEHALNLASEVFSHLYGLRHNRSYHVLWLILRGRLAAGLLRPETLLSQKAEWLELLRDAGLQMRKFGSDHRRLSPEKLREALGPLLAPWPSEWAVAHPVLAELDRRLGLSVFREAVAEIRADNVEGAAAKFSLRKKELESLLQMLRTEWSKAAGAAPAQRKATQTRFLRALAAFVGKRAWFPGALALPLLGQFQALGDWMSESLSAPSPSELNATLSLEVAASVLLLQEVVERQVRWTQELEHRIGHQAKRLGWALQGRAQDLRAAAPVRWDARWRERQVAKAIQLIFEQLSQNVGVVEKCLADWVRGEDVEEVRARLGEMKGRCRAMARVLATVREPSAAKLAEGIRDGIEGLGESKDPVAAESVQTLAPAVAALSRFIRARCDAEPQAQGLLEPGLVALFGVGTMGVPEKEAPESLSAQPGPLDADSVVIEGSDATPPRDIRSELLNEGVWDNASDRSLLDVFLEETEEALAEIALARAALREAPVSLPDTHPAWETLRRQFHTLKGSGRICGLSGLGEVAWWAEARINEAFDLQEPYGSALDAALGWTATRLESWYGQLRASVAVHVSAADVKAALDAAPPILDGLSPANEGLASEAWPLPTTDGDKAGTLAEGAQPTAWEEAGDSTVSNRALPEASPLAKASEQQQEDFPADDGLNAIRHQELADQAESLAGVLIRRELAGSWDVETIHRAAHTIAALAAALFQPDVQAFARHIEQVASDWQKGVLAPGEDDPLVIAIRLLREGAERLAEGDTAWAVPEGSGLLGWGRVSASDEDLGIDWGAAEFSVLEAVSESIEENSRSLDGDLGSIPPIALPSGSGQDEAVPVRADPEIEGEWKSTDPVAASLHDAAEMLDHLPSFQTENRNSLRRKPSVILVNEDGAEAVGEAVAASTSGHLVHTTVHAKRDEGRHSADGDADTVLDAAPIASPPLDSDGGSEATVETMSDVQPLDADCETVLDADREADWDAVFEGLETVQAGLRLLGQALVRLRERDERV